jgi:hypothetical protein
MEASFFRGLAAVNGFRPPEAAREERAIDSLKTSEVHASMRKDGAVCSGGGPGRLSPRKTGAASADRITKSRNAHPVL